MQLPTLKLLKVVFGLGDIGSSAEVSNKGRIFLYLFPDCRLLFFLSSFLLAWLCTFWKSDLFRTPFALL
jgi:hypothetical protein